MQAHYDVVKLAFRPNGVAAALPRIERALASSTNAGTLLAVLVAEIGELNQVLILHAIDAPGAPLATRDARQRRGDLFARSPTRSSAPAHRRSHRSRSCRRSKRDGTARSTRCASTRSGAARFRRYSAAWEPALPARIALSPIVTAAYALDGEQPRMMHIWP